MNIFKKLYSKVKFVLFMHKELKIGKGTKVLTKLINFGSEPYLIEIGENCLITSGVKFITHDGSIMVPLKKYEDKKIEEVYGKYNIFGEIKIGNNCFIGIGAIVLPGVSLGDNTIVAAGAVVTKSFGENVVIGGNPAKIISTLDKNYNKIKKKIVEVENRDFNKRKKEIKKRIGD